MEILATLIPYVTLAGLIIIFAILYQKIYLGFNKMFNQRNQQEQLWHEDFSQKLYKLETAVIKELHQAHLTSISGVQEHIHKHMQDIRAQMDHSFKHHTESLTQYVKTLNQEVKENLFNISQQVNQQLNQGFEKNAATFGDVAKRLIIIDEAQKKITELSSNVVSLQEILSDKKSRGAFGEVQLTSLIQNMIPAQHFSFQHTLSNHKRADCVLFLPPPSGNVVIDAKFPLESYQLLHTTISEAEKIKIKQQFRIDIKKHINDIAEKYIIADETADGAMMFIPAEAIFAEIHSNYPDLVQASYDAKVWMVSPTTLMAVLTTARAVLKDDATRKQVHIIQQHLHLLSQDFKRFDKRIVNLSKHIAQAHQDVDEVTTSAKKITQRFDKIEHLELDESVNNIKIEKVEPIEI